jgi:outer membrane lipoprotein
VYSARIGIFTAMILCMVGCAHVIPEEILEEVDTSITFSNLKSAPKAYRGRVVLLGGVIVGSVNRKDGTLLEVYQTEINQRGEPMDIDISEGRFLALYEGFLDTAIYRKGRKVTIVGIVQGELIQRLDELNYHYPLVLIKEIHLWKEEYMKDYEYCHWGYGGSWWYSPFSRHDLYWLDR